MAKSAAASKREGGALNVFGQCWCLFTTRVRTPETSDAGALSESAAQQRSSLWTRHCLRPPEIASPLCMHLKTTFDDRCVCVSVARRCAV